MATISLELPPGWPAWLSLHRRRRRAACRSWPRASRGPPAAGCARSRSPSARRRARGRLPHASRPGPGRPIPPRPAGQPRDGGCAAFRIENEIFLIEADPARGGTLSRLLDKRSGTELLQPGGGGNELLLQPEHPQHPRWAEGPWLLCPAGPGTGSAAGPAAVRAERCPVGSRLVAELELGGLRVTQETLLWDGADRVEFRTHVDGSIGQDRLLRVVFPASVPGGLPVYQTAVSVIGGRQARSTPTSPSTPTLSTARPTSGSPSARPPTVALAGTGARQLQAIGVAEVVAPPAVRTGCGSWSRPSPGRA